MPLFQNIKTVRKYITISAANSDVSVPNQRRAEQEFLIPLLGQSLFNTMQAEAITNPVTPSPLLDKCYNAMAYLMYFKELPFLHTRITDTGLKNTNTDTQTTAYRYQFENILSNCESEGRAGLEEIFNYLVENIIDYPEWESSTAYARLNKNLIKTGSDFASYYFLPQPHRTFNALQPVLQEVEDFFLKPTVGAPFFTALKDAASPTEDEREVLELLRKALANFTISKACTKLSVKVRPEGFTVMLGAGSDKDLSGEASAPDKAVEKLKEDTLRDGNNYLNAARKILNERATDAIFPIYFASAQYKSPTVDITNNNDILKGVYIF